MFWIGIGSILLIFFGVRSYRNNQKRWRQRSLKASRFYFFLMQGGNIVLIFASLLFLMLAVVCHVKGFQISFSSDYPYHMHINAQ